MLVTLESHGLVPPHRAGGWPGWGSWPWRPASSPSSRAGPGRAGDPRPALRRDRGADRARRRRRRGRRPGGRPRGSCRSTTGPARHPAPRASGRAARPPRRRHRVRGRARAGSGAAAAVLGTDGEPIASLAVVAPPTGSPPTTTWPRRSDRGQARRTAWPRTRWRTTPREEDAVPYYRSVGDIRPSGTPSSAPDGRLYAEELMGTDGFSSSSALLYHRRPPTALVGRRTGRRASTTICATTSRCSPPPADHRVPADGDLVTGRRVLLANDDVAGRGAPCAFQRPLPERHGRRGGLPAHGCRGWSPRSAPSTAAPATTSSCPPGRPPLGPPSARVRRWRPWSSRRATSVRPRRYLSAAGQFRAQPLLRARPPRAGRTARRRGRAGRGRRRGPRAPAIGLTRYRYAHHPFDVVGWDGCLYPYRLSVHDFEPIWAHPPAAAGPPDLRRPTLRRVQLRAPPARLPPRRRAGAYNHANVDSDEVLFYCDGDFTSRKGAGIGAGSISLHPGGSPTAPSRAASRPRSAPSPPTSWRSWSTPSPLRLSEARACGPGLPWTWAAAGPDGPDPDAGRRPGRGRGERRVRSAARRWSAAATTSAASEAVDEPVLGDDPLVADAAQ